MPSQRLGETEFDTRKALCQPVARSGQIPAHMDSWRKKIRHKNNALGALLDATGRSAVDVRLGQFEKRHLHEGVPALAQPLGHMVQVRVRLGISAAMRYE